MAAKGNSFAERFARWHVVVDNLKQIPEGLEHVAADQQLLEQQLGEANALQTRLEDLRSQFRVATARIRKLAAEGDSNRSRIGANLQGKYGFTSETLLRYGFNPRRVPRRRSQKEKEKELEKQKAEAEAKKTA